MNIVVAIVGIYQNIKNIRLTNLNEEESNAESIRKKR